MKKWLMLASLPLLLPAQREVGATPLPQETLVATGNQNGYSFTTTFHLQDKHQPNTGLDTGYDYTDITVIFAGVDLNLASTVLQNGSDSDSDAVATSVISFYTSNAGLTNQYLKLTDLISDPNNPSQIIENPSGTYAFNRQINTSILTMTAYYTTGGGDGTNFPQVNQPVCMEVYDPNSNPQVTQICGSLESVSVPLPNSLMLLGIGLLALTVPPRRGKLLNIPL